MSEDPNTPPAAPTDVSAGEAAPVGANPHGSHDEGQPGRRDQPASRTSDEAAVEEDIVTLSERVIALDFEIAKSIRYHAKRCAFFGTLNHVTRGFAAIFAAGAVISLVGKNTFLSGTANVLVAITLALDLVLDYSARARVHDDLRRDFGELLAEMEEHPPATDADYRRLSAKRLKIQVHEPPAIEVLNVVCANEELEGRGYDYRYHVTRLQYALRNFFSWSPSDFPREAAPDPKR